MTAKTTKHKIYYSLAAIVAISVIAGLMYAEQDADANQITFRDHSVSRTDLVENAKAEGIPYIKSVPIAHDEVIRKGFSNQIPIEVVLIAPNNNEATVTLRPVVQGQFTISHEATESFSTAQIRNAVESKQLLDGMYDKSEFVSFDKNRIVLKANEPQQILVTLSIVDKLSDKYTDNPFRVNIGYEIIESNIGDKIPRDYESLEIRSK